MKKFNLNQLSMSWNEKQTPQRKWAEQMLRGARVLAERLCSLGVAYVSPRYNLGFTRTIMLSVLILFGVGQMWAAKTVYLNTTRLTGWEESSATFYVKSGATSYQLTAVAGKSHLYSNSSIPDGWTSVTFERRASDKTSVWNSFSGDVGSQNCGVPYNDNGWNHGYMECYYPTATYYYVHGSQKTGGGAYNIGNDNARIWIYYFSDADGSNNNHVEATRVETIDSYGRYVFQLPAGTWHGIIVVRTKPSTDFCWSGDNFWGKTEDKYLVTNNNLATVDNSWTTYVPTSTGQVTASATTVAPSTAVTLTPSITSNTTYNVYKSVSYSVNRGTKNTDWSIDGNTFTPLTDDEYTITATITYNAKGFASITSTVAPTVTITCASDPAIAMTSVSPSALAEGENITLVAERANSTDEIVFQYSTNSGSTWTDIESPSPSVDGDEATLVWPIPAAHGATRTFIFRAVLKTDDVESDESSDVTVYGKKTIHVRNTNDWNAMNLYTYNKVGEVVTAREDWSGSTTGVTATTGQWYDVVLTSQYEYFILNDGTNQITGNETYYYSRSSSPAITNDAYYQIQEKPAGGNDLTLTSISAPAAPSVTTSEATVGSATSVTFNYSVSANRDKATPGIAFKQSDSDIADAATLYSSGTKVAGSATNGNASVSTSAQTITAGKDWYYVAYATNGVGTSYGDIRKIRTTTVTLDNQSATTAGQGSVVAVGGKAMPSIAANMPAKTGYTFGGYWTGASGTGTQYYNADGSSKANWKTDGAASETLKAKWTANQYDVTLKLNTGTGTDNQVVQATYDANMPTTLKAGGAISIPTKTGYTLLGYWDATSNGTQYYSYSNSTLSSSRTWDKTSETNLYARWQANQYTLTLYKNDGGDTYTTQNATYDATITITAPTRTGYTFTGYWTTASGDGTKIIDTDNHFVASVEGYTGTGKIWKRTSATDLYARWTANEYTITLNDNGGSGGDETHSVTFDAATGTLTSTPAKTGYTFTGYYTSSDTKIFNADLTPVKNVSGYTGNNESKTWIYANNVTLYAHWEANSYSVEFDANDGSGSMSDQEFTYDVAQNLTEIGNSIYRNGYHFDGWATAADGDVAYEDGEEVENLATSGTYTLYAHWTQSVLTDLTFSPTSAAGSSSVTITPTLSPSPTGTTCICWGLYYDSECTREVDGITFSSDPSSGAASVSFTTPASSGTYYVKADFRAGSACNASLLNSRTESFLVQSAHTVKVKYVCSGVEIAPRGSVEIPAAGSAGVKALSGNAVFGYTFSSWSLGDGLENTCADGTSCGTGKDSIRISATDDGVLTANYTRKSIVYFKNTLNWTNVYYHHSYWDNSQGGAGNKGQTRNQAMTLVPGTTDIYYWEGTPDDANVAFTDATYDNYQAFWAGEGAKVVYPSNPTCAESGDNAYGFNAGTPLFVPIEQEGIDFNDKDDGKAIYFNKGYWREYEPATGKTGYTLEIYNKVPNSSRYVLYSIPMTDVASGTDIFEATISLEANKTGDSKYGVKILRNTGMRYTNTSGTFAKNGDYTTLSKQNDDNAAIGLETTVAGDYIVRVTCGNDGVLKAAVTYPAAEGDYQLWYKDNEHTAWHPSEIVRKVNNGKEIVSFFIRDAQSPQVQVKTSAIDGETGAVTWTDSGSAINLADSVSKDGVYNLYLSMNGSGALKIDSVRPYTGNFYIRTDIVGGTRWADFRNASHQMTYSDYAASKDEFTHYYMHWVTKNTNVKFTVANDYSPCVSDTLAKMDGEIIAGMDTYGTFGNTDSANVRFMYNEKTNAISRAYLAGAQGSGTYFLVLQGEASKLLTSGGDALVSANNGGVSDNAIQLSDDRDWIYKASVKAVPGGKVKLYAKLGSNYAYFVGKSPDSDWSTSDAYETLIGGEGDAQSISVVYDFKTNRLIAAWEPANEINSQLVVNADIIIVRDHQAHAQNITFSASDKSLSTEKTIYGALKFNRFIINNHSTSEPHGVLPPGDQLPLRQRTHYYISFPFDVNVSDIFGFGTYGVHWVLQYYDGVARAKNGLWADPGMTYWKYVPPTGKLNANEGYLLALSPSNMAYDKTSDGEVWANDKNDVELYFPAASSGATIGQTNITIDAPSSDYVSTINRGTAEGDRTIKDSYWRCIGVPSFADVDISTLEDDESASLAWSDPSTYETGDIHFLYQINWVDYTLSPVTGSSFDFKAMHAYMVQSSTDINWTVVNNFKSSIVARRQTSKDIDNIEFRLALSQDGEHVDQAFVRLTNDEGVTNGFEFGQDMSKEMYSTKANIFTYIGYEPVAANSMPFSDGTTVVPVGVKLAADGEYTFSMPEGTNGLGVVLVDTENNSRTSLSALDYTVYLEAGTYDNRFFLEISPVHQVPTSIENTGASTDGEIRKVMIDGLMYIVKDGQMFDARGAKVK